MGEMRVPSNKYWGAQTQRSLENFEIGTEKMPTEVIKALGTIKLAAAEVNERLMPQRMPKKKSLAIAKAAEEVMSGALDESFPLVVWQTGSGTQTNMNVNEVIARRACELLGEGCVHPNDDVNMSQSSNDVFPSAMHIAAVLETENRLLPALSELVCTLAKLETENIGAVKCGRTHLQDATPISFSQEISGWRASVEADIDFIKESSDHLRALALGATAVGTGLNAPKEFDIAITERLSDILGTEFLAAENKFHAISSKSELAFAHGALKALAADLCKIANDIRWMSSGPRCGLGEIFIPENEPGSSIMPGKVNPTQCEAITMIAVQVMANDTAVAFAASQGNFELNVFMPVCIYNYLQSVRLLADGVRSFNKNCVSGIVANREKMKENLYSSLMTATALTPIVGYENAAKAVKLAHSEGKTLKQACIELGILTDEEFDKSYRPEEMI